MSGSRSVQVTDKDWDSARFVMKLFKNDIASFMAPDTTPRQYAYMVRSVNCPTCGAPPEWRCRTREAGTVTRNHAERLVAMLACIFAMEREIVIHEEDTIDDLL